MEGGWFVSELEVVVLLIIMSVGGRHMALPVQFGASVVPRAGRG